MELVFMFVVLNSLLITSGNELKVENEIEWSKVRSKNIFVENLISLAMERDVVNEIVSSTETQPETQTEPDLESEPEPSTPESDSESRVIGGTEAAPHSRPFQVALVMSGEDSSEEDLSFCGGSLISPNYVLTAAHCLDGYASVQIILGAHNIQIHEPTQQKLTSSNFTLHPNYNSKTIANDIALITLPDSVTFDSYIQPISLATSDTFDKEVAVLSGWGKTSNYALLSNVLMAEHLYLIPNERCSALFIPITFFLDLQISENMICTFGLSSDKNPVGACSGDSGGPLTLSDTQIGIVSFGYLSCTAGMPTVFTRVSSYASWIEENSDVQIYT